MGSPRLVAKNINFHMAKETTAASEGPSYANVSGAFPRQSPIMGRRALVPPSAQSAAPLPTPSPKLHRRQTSEVIKQEVCTFFLSN